MSDTFNPAPEPPPVFGLDASVVLFSHLYWVNSCCLSWCGIYMHSIARRRWQNFIYLITFPSSSCFLTTSLECTHIWPCFVQWILLFVVFLFFIEILYIKKSNTLCFPCFSTSLSLFTLCFLFLLCQGKSQVSKSLFHQLVSVIALSAPCQICNMTMVFPWPPCMTATSLSIVTFFH